MRLQLSCGPRLQASQGRPGLKCFCLRSLMWLSAGFRLASKLAPMSLSTKLPHNMELFSPSAKREQERARKTEGAVFYNNFGSYDLCCILLVSSGSLGLIHTQGEEIPQGHEYREWVTVGHFRCCIWDTHTHTHTGLWWCPSSPSPICMLES